MGISIEARSATEGFGCLATALDRLFGAVGHKCPVPASTRRLLGDGRLRCAGEEQTYFTVDNDTGVYYLSNSRVAVVRLSALGGSGIPITGRVYVVKDDSGSAVVHITPESQMVTARINNAFYCWRFGVPPPEPRIGLLEIADTCIGYYASTTGGHSPWVRFQWGGSLGRLLSSL